MVIHFVRSRNKVWQKFVHNVNGNPYSLQEYKLLFQNLYKLHNSYILMNFYFVVCSRFSWGFWNELGLWRSNAHSESHDTFWCPTLEVHLNPFFCLLPEGPHLIVHFCNKCDSKYTMKSATRMQMFELWPSIWGSFCTRKRKKATM
jgi:hypothetical protein